jgi:hypothetical protein
MITLNLQHICEEDVPKFLSVSASSISQLEKTFPYTSEINRQRDKGWQVLVQDADRYDAYMKRNRRGLMSKGGKRRKRGVDGAGSCLTGCMVGDL